MVDAIAVARDRRPIVRAGSFRGFEAFVLQSSGRLLHAARLLVGSWHDAEDLMQAVLLRM